MGVFTSQWLGVVLLCTLWSGIASCATVPRSSRMTAADFEDMALRMSQSIAAAPQVSGRTPTSEPWIISIDKVRNLSSDVMTDSEQWAIIAKLRGQLPMQALREQKNIRFVIPPERVALLRDNPNLPVFDDDAFASQRKPTHVMHATFRSATRAIAEHRTDLYVAAFEILDIRTGEPVWTGSYDLKRTAAGHVWD